MVDVLIIHESVLYDSFESENKEDRESAERFLNCCGIKNYEKGNVAFLPGEVFERIKKLCEKDKGEEFLAFLEMLTIKYPKKGCDGENKNTPYVNLASDFCINNTVFIVSTNENFNQWLTTQGYLFYMLNPDEAQRLLI